MTDEEIRELARQSKHSLYCKKYKEPWICKNCPIAHNGYTCSSDFENGFVQGYKAAFDALIEKEKSL